MSTNMSSDTNNGLLLPQAPESQPSAPHTPVPVSASTLATSVPSTTSSELDNAAVEAAAAAAVAAINSQHDVIAAAQAEAQAQAQAQMQNGLHQDRNAVGSPNPLKRSLDDLQEENRLKMARLDQPEHSETQVAEMPPPDVQLQQKASSDLQLQQQEQVYSHEAAQDTAQVQNVQDDQQSQLQTPIPSHIIEPPVQNQETVNEVPQDAQQQQQAPVNESTPQPHAEAQEPQIQQPLHPEPHDVMHLMDTEVARRAVEASAAAANAAAVTAAPQNSHLEIPLTTPSGQDQINGLNQSPVTQSVVGVQVATSPTPIDVEVNNIHQAAAAVAIQEASKSQGTMSYPNPSIQHGTNNQLLSNTPNRTMTFPMVSQPSNEKPYGCTQCEMRFRRLHDLKRHSKLHTGEKPHVCPKCDRKFARGDALARHSKGVGGCAARRTSMNTFVDTETLENHNLLDPDTSMNGVYSQTDERDVTTQSDARFGDAQFHNSQVSLQIQGTSSITRDPSTAPTSQPVNLTVGSGNSVYGTGVLATSPKDISQTTDNQRAADGKTTTAGATINIAPALAPATTATPVTATTVIAAPATTNTTNTTSDTGANMFVSSNTAIWTYAVGLEERLNAMEKADKEKSKRLATMEKHISLLLAQLATPKPQ